MQFKDSLCQNDKNLLRCVNDGLERCSMSGGKYPRSHFICSISRNSIRKHFNSEYNKIYCSRLHGAWWWLPVFSIYKSNEIGANAHDRIPEWLEVMSRSKNLKDVKLSQFSKVDCLIDWCADIDALAHIQTQPHKSTVNK